MTFIPELLSVLSAAVYLGGLVVAAGYDLASYRIPNRTVLAVAAAAVLPLVLHGLDFAAVVEHSAVALGVLAVGAVLFAVRVWGGGDAKLLAAAALAAGTEGVSTLVFWTAMVGGLVAASLLVARRLPFLNPAGLKPWCRGLLSPTGGVPYGVAIAAGGIAAFIGRHTVFTWGILGH